MLGLLALPCAAAADDSWYDQEGQPSSGADYSYQGSSSTSTAGGSANDGRGLGIALRLAYGHPFGKLVDEQGADFDKYAAGAVQTQFDLNYAITPHWVVAGQVGLGFGILPSRTRDACDEDDVSCSLLLLNTGVAAEYRILPGAFADPWVGANLGAEWSFLSASYDDTSVSQSLFGLAFGAAAGVDFELGRWGLGPFLGFQAGRFGSGDVAIDTGLGDGSGGGDIDNPAFHYWLQLGVRARYRFAHD